VALRFPEPTDDEKPSGLTMEAVLKHEAIQNYSGHKDPTVNDIAHSLKSFSMSGVAGLGGNEDEMMTESNLGTFKTFKTFASNFSACTNLSFSK
jgi:ribosomal RNA-processing protein 12